MFSRIFCLMFLIGGIKPNEEHKSKTCFIFYATVKGRVVWRVRNKTSFVSFCVWFAGDNKNFIQKKRKKSFIHTEFFPKSLYIFLLTMLLN